MFFNNLGTRFTVFHLFTTIITTIILFLFNAKTVDSNQTPRSLVSDLGQHIAVYDLGLHIVVSDLGLYFFSMPHCRTLALVLN